MGIFDWLFDPTEVKTTTQNNIPEWVENAGKTNYALASGIAQRPYQSYNFPRIAPFSGDQTQAMGMLRAQAPTAAKMASTPYRPPRLIDNIPGESGPGGISDYMNPYVENVVNRGMAKMREAADMGQQNINTQKHMSESFGDARHGLDSAELERDFMKEVGDFSAGAYADAYNNAQGYRESDINRLMQSQDLERARFGDFLTYIDTLYRSGGKQQELAQKSADTAYKDFVEQRDYPQEMLNVLTAALTGTPYSKSTTTTEPGPSNASSILSTLASVFGALL